MKTRVTLFVIFLLFLTSSIDAQSTAWPKMTTETKPWSRWWWMGSAVDTANLACNMEAYSKKGLGGLEITPIYGVQGNDANDISYLSPKWMQMLRFTEEKAKQLGMKIDMVTGTGWPFGGPQITIANAADKVIFQDYSLTGGEHLSQPIVMNNVKQRPYGTLLCLMAFSPTGEKLNLTDKIDNKGDLQWTAPAGTWKLMAVFNGKTLQKVKRAAPGGEGWVMNHFSKKAVDTYLARFDHAFATSHVPYPNAFFNDSYEVFGANWTPDFFTQFAKRRGYRLENYLREFRGEGNADTIARVVSDYRETLAELLLENFTENWTAWAHRHGSITRNQAHGSPGNLIDLYSAADIPECETFGGMPDFNIKGLRKDSLSTTNEADLTTMKYASSAAHINGKKYASSETFTWLTEHFRTSLSECKPVLDMLYSAGINHVFFHGTPYSPKNAAWPGWLFYASIDMSPTDPMWHDAAPFFSYIRRCQSFLQYGKPNNDVLIYLPVYDFWYENRGTPYLAFDIHSMPQHTPHFIKAVNSILNDGYDADYISDRYIATTSAENGLLKTAGGTTYKALVIPSVTMMQPGTLQKLIMLAKNGATIIFVGHYPEDVPGLGSLQSRRVVFKHAISELPDSQTFQTPKRYAFGKGYIITAKDYKSALSLCNIPKEEIRTVWGGSYIRRKNPTGYHYFIASLQHKGINGWVTLGVRAKSAMLFDPLTGHSGKAALRQHNGHTQIYLQLQSGQSIIVKTFTNNNVQVKPWCYYQALPDTLTLADGWSMQFIKSEPAIKRTFNIHHLESWTNMNIPNAKINMGIARYTIKFNLPKSKATDWILNLGDVRESARVYINGEKVETLWSVPYETNVGQYLHPGSNTLQVEVTNLPANRISDYDRRGVKWRIFNEINMVDVHYQKSSYASWKPVPSGLLGPVELIPVVSQPKNINQ
ncbi:alpha-L-rhamnosidase [Microbacter margulisiae]|uniref:Beta-mannosidase-like galactose-binding domain-containing protein n=1 Tax=Microbacter margulisiae TaxID=1350067 RepID=A0A7W5DRN7_9PORP|nr:glycosyl hydrolase [Microbacter margulisiae]MBB3186973.1 hypothetical protein [Microbacter margulisiae]